MWAASTLLVNAGQGLLNYRRLSNRLNIINFSRGQLALLAVLIFFGVCVRINVFEVTHRTPDEWYYRGFAQVVNQRGPIDGVRALIDDYEHEPWRWQNPPPSRIGFIFLNALMQRVLKDNSEEAGAYVSTIASSLALIVLVLCATELMSWRGAIFSACGGAVFPLSLTLARRAWTDSLMELLAILMILGALGMIKTHKVINWAGVIFLLSGAYAFWVKESAGLIVILLVMIPALEFGRLRMWSKIVQLGAVTITTVCLGIGSMAIIVGGLDNIIKVYLHIAQAVPQADYARSYQDGPWFDFLKTFVLLTPGWSILFILGWFGFVVRGLTKQAWGNQTCRIIFYMVTTVVVLSFAASVPLYYKNLRYLSPIYGVLVLVTTYPISAILDSVARWQSHRRFLTVFFCVGFGLALIYDYFNFAQIIERANCPDLNLRMLRQCQQGLTT